MLHGMWRYRRDASICATIKKENVPLFFLSSSTIPTLTGRPIEVDVAGKGGFPTSSVPLSGFVRIITRKHRGKLYFNLPITKFAQLRQRESYGQGWISIWGASGSISRKWIRKHQPHNNVSHSVRRVEDGFNTNGLVLGVNAKQLLCWRRRMPSVKHMSESWMFQQSGRTCAVRRLV